MLYDLKWDLQTQADPFTVEKMIAWLEKQPADEEYNPFIPSICLVGQFCSAHGVRDVPVALHGWLSFIAFGDTAWAPMTFGAALERALAIVEKH